MTVDVAGLWFRVESEKDALSRQRCSHPCGLDAGPSGMTVGVAGLWFRVESQKIPCLGSGAHIPVVWMPVHPA